MCSVVSMYMKKRGAIGELRYCDVRTLKIQADDDAHVSDLDNIQDVDTCHQNTISEEDCG